MCVLWMSRGCAKPQTGSVWKPSSRSIPIEVQLHCLGMLDTSRPYALGRGAALWCWHVLALRFLWPPQELTGPITSPKGVPSAHPSTKLAELVTEQLRTHMSFTQ